MTKQIHPVGEPECRILINKANVHLIIVEHRFESNRYTIERVYTDSNATTLGVDDLHRMGRNVDALRARRANGEIFKLVDLELHFDALIRQGELYGIIKIVDKDGQRQVQRFMRLIPKPAWANGNVEPTPEAEANLEQPKLSGPYWGPGGKIHMAVQHQEVIKAIDLSQFDLGLKWYLTASHGFAPSKFYDTYPIARYVLKNRKLKQELKNGNKRRKSND